MGLCSEKIQDIKQGVDSYKTCLTIESNHFGACLRLANLLANQSEAQRAVKYFKHAIKIDKDSVNAHFGLGKTLQKFSEDKEAPIPHY